jgi:hypothetical protein
MAAFRSPDGSCWYTTTKDTQGETYIQISIVNEMPAATWETDLDSRAWELIQDMQRMFERRVAARICLDASAFVDGVSLLLMQAPVIQPVLLAVRLAQGTKSSIALTLADLDRLYLSPIAAVTVDAATVDHKFPVLAFSPSLLAQTVEDMQEHAGEIAIAKLEVAWIGPDAVLRIALGKFEGYIAPMG